MIRIGMLPRFPAWALAALLLWKGTVPSTACAQATDAGRALLAITDADPLELARVAQRFGDRAIRALIDSKTEVAVCLAAVRTARWLRAPETALPALAELAAGRDSLLAPAAARAVLTIAAELDEAALLAREHPPGELAKTRATLLSTALRATTAPDIRVLVDAAAEQLRASGVP